MLYIYELGIFHLESSPNNVTCQSKIGIKITLTQRVKLNIKQAKDNL